MATSEDYDPMCHTFTDAKEFCWNSVEGPVYDNCVQYRCLGHPTAAPDCHSRQVRYADDTLGHARRHSDSVLMTLKSCVQDFRQPAADGLVARLGLVGGQYHDISTTRTECRKIVDLALSVYWAQSDKTPIVGLEVYKKRKTVELPEERLCTVWDDTTLIPPSLKRSDVPEPEFVQPFMAGVTIAKLQGSYRPLAVNSYTPLLDYVIYHEASVDEAREYEHRLEIDGFPGPTSSQMQGASNALTSFGIERGRLLSMYKLGSDTSAVMMLLLHAASKLSIDGIGTRVLPAWCDDSDRELLLHDLRALVLQAEGRVNLTDTQISTLAGRFKIKLLTGVISGLNPTRLAVPSRPTGYSWNEVSYRLTLGWKRYVGAAEAAAGGVSPPALAEDLSVERFEIAGAASVGQPEQPCSPFCKRTLTLFFDDPDNTSSIRDDRVNFHTLNIKGEDAKYVLPDAAGTGHGSFLSQADINELSRRTGIKNERFQQALGTLHVYRIFSGLLQRKVFQRSTGQQEFLTIIPDADWRTVEFAGERRRLSLRRYVILVFHVTAAGPHRGREQTVQAIQDAGCWWDNLTRDVTALIRHCEVCKCTKGTPTITGHQRSREYDGPFRYLEIDFVGPIQPRSGRGHRFMFTCTCPWSGWYWAFPTEDDTSETAAQHLFFNVMLDLAGYPMMLGSDRGKAFIESVVKELLRIFDVTHVIGTSYHPQAQAAVERPHREYNAICKTFMEQYSQWDLMVYVFVWCIRTTSKVVSGTYTPYEIITGMKPRSPIDAVLSMPTAVEKITHHEYVAKLIEYLRQVHEFVDSKHQDVRRREQEQALRLQGHPDKQPFRVGDYVLVKKPPVKEVSRRFQRPYFDQVFQVVDTVGMDSTEVRTYRLSDLTGNTENLGFQQPVAQENLSGVEMLPLVRPSEDQRTRISLDFAGAPRTGTVVNQCIDGSVHILLDGDEQPKVFDLSATQYRWL